MKIQTIDHLVLTTEKLEECLHFYGEVLGMKITHENNRYALHFGNQKINIHTRKGEFQPAAANPSYGSLDICFVVNDSIENIQKEMFERAKAHRDSHISDAKSYPAFKDAVENKPGFIRAMWCGETACEEKIKEDTIATSRCMPLEDQEPISDVCVCCGKPAHKLVYWGKAY